MNKGHRQNSGSPGNPTLNCFLPPFICSQRPPLSRLPPHITREFPTDCKQQQHLRFSSHISSQQSKQQPAALQSEEVGQGSGPEHPLGEGRDELGSPCHLGDCQGAFGTSALQSSSSLPMLATLSQRQVCKPQGGWHCCFPELRSGRGHTPKSSQLQHREGAASISRAAGQPCLPLRRPKTPARPGCVSLGRSLTPPSLCNLILIFEICLFERPSSRDRERDLSSAPLLLEWPHSRC